MTASRDIQNGWILSGQPSHLHGKSLALCFAWLNEHQVQNIDTYKSTNHYSTTRIV